MASVRFFIKGKSKPASINVRFKRGSKFDISRTTSLTINPKYWNQKQGKIRPVAEFEDRQSLEKDLNLLKSKIYSQYNIDFPQGVNITGSWLNEVIQNYFNQDNNLNKDYLIDFARYYLKNLPNKIQKDGTTGVKPATLKKYETNLRKLEAFEVYKRKRFLIAEVDAAFHREFIAYLKDKEHLNYNSIGKYITIVKTICLDAYRTHGMKINDAILNGNFRTTKEATNFITLSENEIGKIFNKDFSNKPHLDNARNWLIIGVWTGARVSDLLNLDVENIRNGFIEYTSQKTGQKIVMPLHWQVSAILDKASGKFPHKISSQKFNDYIKKVCKQTGITQMLPGTKREEIGEDKNGKKIWRKKPGDYEKWELVSTHICRRSFATNHYGKLPTPVIMSATGHKTEKMLLNYIGKAPKDNADVLAQYWKNAKTKQDKAAKMKIAN